jgi:hypothetical protein
MTGFAASLPGGRVAIRTKYNKILVMLLVWS